MKITLKIRQVELIIEDTHLKDSYTFLDSQEKTERLKETIKEMIEQILKLNSKTEI